MRKNKLFKKYGKSLRPYIDLISYLFARILSALPVSSEIIGSPKKAYKSTYDWIIQYNSRARVAKSSYQEIYPSYFRSSSEIRTTDKKIHAEFQKQQNRVTSNAIRSAFVASIPNGRIWGYHQHGIIITPDDGVLIDISYEGRTSQTKLINDETNHPIFRKFKLEPVTHLNETVALLSVRGGQVYYHWMFNLLPKIHLLNRSIGIDNIDKFVINKVCTKFQEETLRILGVPQSKLIEIDGESFHVKANQVVVTSFTQISTWSCEFLRSEFLKHTSPKVASEEYIYISRGDARKRRVANEGDVINYLEKFGFKIVTLESMSVLEQAQLFSSAKAIVAPHGAGLTNAVFCQPGTKLVEFFSPNYVHPLYWDLSNHVGLEYYYFLGEQQHLPSYHNPNADDIVINLNSLAKTLQLAGISKQLTCST
ncbi:capsular polysaccharide biosynthesis protein-like protein [Gloeocapsa sp. PCC 7428]|uniref:glycosyltransferase family 61 protein n=1 Tax=Gloeocapsa sp. PCC 7428 TaxID=1173026 RepID=UPI0002A5D592|nr:glycosyltransferase family 61 protein [Gloeocapsa sp. PCC 7428]AFZ29869.1 capsular polysaccharide biosynthesis protein-like protein [Gloeocapsa sp. PCC 7428]